MIEKEKNFQIDLNKYDGFLNKFISDLEDNLYYNQIWVWCEKCGKRHRINSNISCDHRVKPLPLNCQNIEDHCWKITSKRKYGYIDVIIGRKNYKYIDFMIEGCAIYKCIVCGKEKLSKGYFLDSVINLEDQIKKESVSPSIKKELKEIIKYIKELKQNGQEIMKKYDLEFAINEKTYYINDLNIKIQKIQHLEELIINN